MRSLFMCLLALGLAGSPAHGQDNPPPEADSAAPATLRLEPGHHVGLIVDLFFSRDGKRVISVGADKTVRTWDAQTGERLRVLHLPGGHPQAAALAPDGITLLVSRTFQPDGGPGKPAHSLAYLLNLQDGRIVPLATEGALAGVGSVAVAFAAGGDRAFVGQKSTFWIWTGLKGIWGTNVAPGGVKPTGQFHYDTKDERDPGGFCGVAPTPDGTRLAVRSTHSGFQIWDVYLPERPVKVASRPVRDGRILGMAWSRDGKRLATGHFFCKTGLPNPVRLWSAEGKELKTFSLAGQTGEPWDGVIHRLIFRSPTELYAACQQGPRRFVLALNPANGSVRELFRTGEYVYFGAVAALAPDGRHLALADGPGRCRVALFGMDDKAARLRYLAGPRFDAHHVGWNPAGHALARNVKIDKQLDTALDLVELKLWGQIAPGKFAQATHKRSDGWELQSGGEFDKWRVVIRRQGKVVAQTPPQAAIVRDFTLPPKGEVRWIAVATGGGFTLHDPAGRRLHAFQTPGTVHAVAPSPDGKYLAAATSAQLMCIYHPEQPAPLLTVFLTGAAWIAWTDRGYYAASPGAERFMGWRVENGPNQLATFYTASQFRASRYRPDVIARLLEDGSLAKALEEADKAKGVARSEGGDVEDVLPPKVELVVPGLPVSGKVTMPKLEVVVTAHGAGKHPITSVQLRLDGRPWEGAKGVRRIEAAKPGAEVKEKWTVELPAGEHTLRALAHSAVSMGMSDEVEVNFEILQPKPRLFVLAIGIDRYDDKNLQLKCAVNDATELEGALKEHSKELFEVEALVLPDDKATRKGILDGLDWLKKKQMQPQDVAVVFYAGHGDLDGKSFYLLPQDVDRKRLADTGISGDLLKQKLADLPGKVVLWLDACHSGAIGRAIGDLARDLADDDSGVVVLCAALGGETAGEKDGHGYFCRALIEGLAGKAAHNPRDGKIYLHHLEQYVIDRVEELSNDEQHPAPAKPAMRPFALAKPKEEAPPSSR